MDPKLIGLYGYRTIADEYKAWELHKATSVEQLVIFI